MERPMLGAPAFAARAALQTGCGLVVLAAPEPILPQCLVIVPGATGVGLPVGPDRQIAPSAGAQRLASLGRAVHAYVVGPGMGSDFTVQQLVVQLLAQDEVPVVLDADGLNALSVLPEFHLDLRASTVMTPHPGEFARLAAALSLEHELTTDADRANGAATLARRLGVIVLLKGARTVVSDGLRTWVGRCGNAALATAGSGDVLSGILGSVIAQFHPRGLAALALRSPVVAARAGALAGGLLDLYDCARLAATIHGEAAVAWSARHGEAGLLAEQLADEVPHVLQRMRQ